MQWFADLPVLVQVLLSVGFILNGPALAAAWLKSKHGQSTDTAELTALVSSFSEEDREVLMDMLKSAKRTERVLCGHMDEDEGTYHPGLLRVLKEWMEAHPESQ